MNFTGPKITAPLAVTVVDLVTETVAPDYNEWAAYILAIAPYAMGAMGKGNSEFVSLLGVAAFPWAAKKLYTRVKGMGLTKLAGNAMAGRFNQQVSRVAKVAAKPEFAGTVLY
jgi:hypothetical protein